MLYYHIYKMGTFLCCFHIVNCLFYQNFANQLLLSFRQLFLCLQLYSKLTFKAFWLIGMVRSF
jgi:hypothetical protein